MSNYRTIRDITRSNARRVEDVDPELVVFAVDHTKSHMPLASTGSKVANAIMDEMLKKRLSVSVGEELLEKNGWGVGTRLPFANKENQDLEKLLELKQRKYLLLQTELRDNADHLTMLEQNFNRASEDIVAYQNFLGSRKKQIEEEKNLAGLAERMHSKVLQDRQKTEKALKGCRQRCEKMQCNQDRRLKNLCELRDLIEFDRDALKDYHQRLRDYQNQKFELGRIIEEDSKTIEQIDKNYVELGAKRKTLKMELDQQAMTTSKCQEQLDRLSMEFRKVYRHRQEMITLWSTNIENAKKKDAQMQDIADDYFDARERLRDLNSEMEFRERQYRSVQCGIRGTHLHVSELDKKLSELRRLQQYYKELVIQLKDSLIEVQQDIRASSNEQKNLIATYEKIDADSAELQEKLERMRGVVAKLRVRLGEVSDLRYTSDQHINEMEKLLNEELKRGDAVLREMELTRKFFWERSNDKKSIDGEIIHLDMSLHRLKSNLSNLEAKEFANMEFLAKQSAKVYRLDLDCSTLENKISRAQNDSVNPMFFILQSRISQLREEGKTLVQEKKYIMQELGHLEILITKNSIELAKNREEKGKLSTNLLEINMVSQRTQKLIDQSDKQLQDMQVESSLETVNLRRLTDAVKLAREQLFGLSEERKTIYWAVEERKTEIESHRLLNLTKSKGLIDAVNKLKVQVQEMEGRTEKLKGRFEILTKMMTGSQSIGTEEDSIGYKVRKAARERESLQMELKRWEARVEEAKHELAGLENVHRLLQASNMAVKETLSPIKEGSDESQELEILNQEEKSIHVRKSRAQRFKVILIDKIEELKQQMSVMEQETGATAQLCKVKESMASRIENDLHRQKEKVQRWNSLCCKLLKEVKPLINKDDFGILQKDLKLRFVQEKMDCAFTMLDRLLIAFPQYRQMVQEFFETDQNLYGLIFRIMKLFSSNSLGSRAVSRQITTGRTSSQNPTARTSGSGLGSLEVPNKKKVSREGETPTHSSSNDYDNSGSTQSNTSSISEEDLQEENDMA